jgi:aspartyl protease family protein
MGFMDKPPVRILSMLFALAHASVTVHAADVSLAGVFGGKAVLVIDGGVPRTLKPGAHSPEGVKLVSVEGDSAWVEIDSRRVKLRIGENVALPRSAAGSSGPAAVHLNADPQGHFLSDGAINGTPVRFLLDTGATVIALGRTDARRANINTSQSPVVTVQTANGVVRAWRVRLNSVKLGSVTLNDVEAAVMETDMPHVLLGMSFLNRMDMRREGSALYLRQRY